MPDSHVNLIDQSIWERGVPYEAFAELRRTDPVYWHEEPDGPGFWALTRHDDIRTVSKDPKRFSSYEAGVSRLDMDDPVMLEAYRTVVIAMDPPDHPDQLAKLRKDRSLIPTAVEEMLRYWPPIHHFRRTAMSHVEMRGKQIRRGDKVLMWYPSANRDTLVFDDPNRFDIRRDPNDHLTFGFGEHFCLAANLARLELRVMWEELLARTDDIVPFAEPRRLRSNLINGIKEMRVELKPA